MNNLVKQRLSETTDLLARLRDDPALGDLITEVAAVCVHALENGGKIMLAGNGGSAADSQHLAGELVSRFTFDRSPLPAIALTTDASILTSVANDYGYEQVFARQIRAQSRMGDVFFAISTSGRSANVIQGLQACREAGVVSVGLTGRSGGDMVGLCDYCFRVPHDATPRIQEAYIVIGHLICELVERSIFSEDSLVP